MWKGLKRRVSKLYYGNEGEKGQKSNSLMSDDPFFTMGVQYKSFDPDYAQVYGMYHKEDQILVEEDEASPSKP